MLVLIYLCCLSVVAENVNFSHWEAAGRERFPAEETDLSDK